MAMPEGLLSAGSPRIASLPLEGKAGDMKESGKERLKYVVYESTLSTAPRSPFPNGEG